MNQILLVEGKDDLFVFSNIFEKHKVKESFKIKDKDGIDQLLKSIPIYLKTDNSSIGIIIDSDSNINGRWDQLRSIFLEQGYTIPKTIETDGFIGEHDDLPTIGVWLMPNNQNNGMLEDFIQFLIPEDDRLMPYVDNVLNELESNDVNLYKTIHKSKAKIHTWLAWQESPGTPMGLAINKTYLNTNNDLCIAFVNWTNRLFNS